MRFDLLEMSIQPSNLLSCFFAQSLLLRLRSSFFVAQPPFLQKKRTRFLHLYPFCFPLFFVSPCFLTAFRQKNDTLYSSLLQKKYKKHGLSPPPDRQKTNQKVLQNLFFMGVKRGQLNASCLFRLPGRVCWCALTRMRRKLHAAIACVARLRSCVQMQCFERHSLHVQCSECVRRTCKCSSCS